MMGTFKGSGSNKGIFISWVSQYTRFTRISKSCNTTEHTRYRFHRQKEWEDHYEESTITWLASSPTRMAPCLNLQAPGPSGVGRGGVAGGGGGGVVYGEGRGPTISLLLIQPILEMLVTVENTQH